MTKHEHHAEAVIELGSVLDQTKGTAMFNEDNDGGQRDNLPGIISE